MLQESPNDSPLANNPLPTLQSSTVSHPPNQSSKLNSTYNQIQNALPMSLLQVSAASGIVSRSSQNNGLSTPLGNLVWLFTFEINTIVSHTSDTSSSIIAPHIFKNSTLISDSSMNQTAMYKLADTGMNLLNPETQKQDPKSASNFNNGRNWNFLSTSIINVYHYFRKYDFVHKPKPKFKYIIDYLELSSVACKLCICFDVNATV